MEGTRYPGRYEGPSEDLSGEHVLSSQDGGLVVTLSLDLPLLHYSYSGQTRYEHCSTETGS